MIFFYLFGYFDTQNCCSRQLPHNLRAQCGLGCACMEGRDCVKLSYAKNARAYDTVSHHWQNNTVPTCALWFKGENPYYAGEPSHWWGKCQGKITVKLFDALQWAIITTLSRKVDQLTEIHARGIIVVKNTLLLMTFLLKFFAQRGF